MHLLGDLAACRRAAAAQLEHDALQVGAPDQDRRELAGGGDERPAVGVEHGPAAVDVGGEPRQAVARAVQKAERLPACGEAESPPALERRLDACGEERGVEIPERLARSDHHAQALVLGIDERETEIAATVVPEPQRPAGVDPRPRRGDGELEIAPALVDEARGRRRQQQRRTHARGRPRAVTAPRLRRRRARRATRAAP